VVCVPTGAVSIFVGRHPRIPTYWRDSTGKA
jgi:hypothetical protein